MLGLEGENTITKEMSVWNNVVVTPSDKAYEKAPEKEEKEPEQQTEAMDTSQE